MACALAGEGEALFLDTRTMAYDRVRLPPGVDLVVINSGIAHRHASGDYRTRRAECERAALMLGVPQLRDLTREDLPRLEALRDPLNRRARHVLTEDQRVLDAVEAMRAGDAARVGALFYESHASMRDDYAVSIAEIDRLVELARREPAVLGARLTGGGFGGSIVALVEAGTAAGVGRRVAEAYARDTGERPTVLVP
jgi:galactokinase